MWRRGVTEITATFLLIEMIPRTRVARKTYLDLLKKVSTLAMLISLVSRETTYRELGRGLFQRQVVPQLIQNLWDFTTQKCYSLPPCLHHH